MSGFVPWDSQSLSEWSRRYAPGDFVELDGRSTHYLERGAGKPVILIHGFHMDGYTWIKNIDAIAEEHKVYALDLWGLGFSSREDIDPGYELYCQQLLSFMDEKGIAKATLVGHSMGGGTAIFFALKHPSRVEKLVLVDATGIPNKLPLRSKIFTLPSVGEYLMGINNNYLRRKNLGELWLYDKERLTEEVFDQFTRFHKIEGSTDILLEILRKEFFHTLGEEIEQLGQLDFEVLIIWGRSDQSVPLENGEKMHRILKGSQFEVIEKGGHMPNFDNPELFNRLVLKFLADLPESRAA
jgi:pimeloyl-ACP methyl ester carboxylesterase